jgi:Chaperone of endosialidase
MDKSSDAILKLRPVTFHYKSDTKNAPQFGLVAEEVEKVDPDLVLRDEDGKVFAVCYEAVDVMLLNEFLKEHRKVEEQQAAIAQLKSAVSEQTAMNAEQRKEMQVMAAELKDQRAQIQRVSARVAASDTSAPVPTNH